MDKHINARSIFALTAIVVLLAACDLTRQENALGSSISSQLMTEEAQTATANAPTGTPTPTFTPSPTPTPCGHVNKTFKGPAVCSFTAVFIQDDYSTFYTVVANDPAGGALTYKWSNSNPCGNFMAKNLPQVEWHHPDSNLPGACPVQDVHPGTITVVITSAGGSVKCEYLDGSAPGNLVQCVNQ